MPSPKKQTLAIIGVGMMGGSLGMAVKKRGLPYRVVGVGRKASRLALAKKLKACDDVTTDLERGLKDADLVVVCTGVSENAPMVKRAGPYLKAGAVVSDIGSVKAPILEAVQGIEGFGSKFDFVGAHPMAGSEKTGVENGNAKLYEKATVVICPGSSKPLSSKKVSRLWTSVGAKILEMKPEIHDILAAQTSHLPHVLAAALSSLIGRLREKDTDTQKLLAGSFRDMTRIADSDPLQWSEICRANQKFLIGALKSYADILQQLVRAAGSGDASIFQWESFFMEAKEQRKKLLN